MKIAEVIGTVVATEHHPDFDGMTLLLCRPLDATGAPRGAAIVAIDRAQAGIGDRVLLMREGNSIRQILGRKKVAIRSAVVGIIDSVDVEAAPEAAADPAPDATPDGRP